MMIGESQLTRCFEMLIERLDTVMRYENIGHIKPIFL